MTDSVLHIAANRSIAEAIAVSPLGWSSSPWPLGSLWYSLVPQGIVKSSLLLIALGLWGFRLYRSEPQASLLKLLFVLLFVPLILARDLLRGVFPSGSDPFLTLLLWVAFFSVHGTFLRSGALSSLKTAVGVGIVLFVWCLSDLSWPIAILLSTLLLLRGDARRGDKSHLLAAIPILLLVLMLLLPFQGLGLLNTWGSAFASPADSAIRLLTGWNSANFQIRREIVLGLFLLLVSGGEFRGQEILSLLFVFALSLISDFGLVPLSLLAAQMVWIRLSNPESFRASATEKAPSVWSPKVFLALTPAVFLIGVYLILSRPEPYPYAAVGQDLSAALQAQPRERVILGDFRISTELLAQGRTPFVDPRNFEVFPQRAAKYEKMVKLDNSFREVLDSERIELLLFPEDSPLINIVRELGLWREIARSGPHRFIVRGNLRTSPFVLMERRTSLSLPKNE